MCRQLFGLVSVVALAGLVSLAAGCGGGGDDDDDIVIVPDATPGPDRDPTAGDGNDSFADAEEITIDDFGGGTGRIQEPGDHDFFKFEGTAGVWLQIVTVANGQDDPTFVDTVIKIYDESMTRVAENDDAVPRINTDSEVIIRLPATGTYYIEVLEFSEWFPLPAPWKGEDTFNFAYTVQVLTVDPNALGVLEDPETGDGIGNATPAKFNNNAGLIIGDFRDGSDVDVFLLAIGGLTAPLSLNTAVAPGGDTGYGSTTSAGDVYITDVSGSTILARIDATTGAFLVSPPIDPSTDYLVWIEHPGGATGANDFYVYKFFVGGGNPPEVEPNDSTGSAQDLENVMFSGSHFILAQLSTDTDKDYFRFQANAGQTISVACAAQSVGSGVRGFTAQIMNQDGNSLVSQQEPVGGAGIRIEDEPAPYMGDYYLRLSKSSQDGGVAGNFARCGVHVR